MSSRWLIRRTPRPDAALRLIGFAHSGGSVGEYVRWGDRLEDVEVWGVQLPGHGERFAEDPLTRLGPLIDALSEGAVFPPGPFAFFGHSLGALVAFELARALRDRGREGPALLFVSALPAPHLPLAGESTEGLDDDALLDALSGAYGAVADELRADPDLRELVLPGLRADLAMVESYRHREAPPLPCPIDAIGGEDDAIDRAELEGWARHTGAAFATHVLPGGHFYFRPDPDDLLAILRRRCREAAKGMAP